MLHIERYGLQANDKKCDVKITQEFTPFKMSPMAFPQFCLGPMLASFHSVLLKQCMVFRSGLFWAERFLELVGGPNRLVNSHYRLIPNNLLELQGAQSSHLAIQNSLK